VTAGIDALRPNARVIVAMEHLPIESSVACHSIIGNEDAGEGELADNATPAGPAAT
jgi:hypothetical protein